MDNKLHIVKNTLTLYEHPVFYTTYTLLLSALPVFCASFLLGHLYTPCILHHAYILGLENTVHRKEERENILKKYLHSIKHNKCTRHIFGVNLTHSSLNNKNLLVQDGVN
jgi:hypothetical protein